MAFDVQAAKAAGYSQEEIDAYLQAKPKTEVMAPVAPGQEVDPGEPPPPPSDQGYQQAGEGNYLPAVGTAVAAAAPYAVPAIATGAGLYGAAKVGGWGRDMLNTAKEGMEAYRHGVNTANEIAQRNVALQQAKMAERAARGGQVVQQAAQGGQQAFQQMGQQLARAPAAPVAPAAPAPAAQQPGVMQRGMDYARQMQRIAADKVMQGARAAAPIAESAAGAARAMAPAAIGLTSALMPGNAGQRYNFPTTGKYAGQEINPMTGRPWTQQELAQYR